MNKRDTAKFLSLVKKTLMIPESDSFADDELQLLIDAGCSYVYSTGVAKEVVESDNPLLEGLLLIYIKTFYGFKNDGSVKELPSSFDILLRQLTLTGGE